MKSFDELYRNSNKYNGEYGRGLTNHLPMALLSLEKLGASIEHINDFHNSYISKLVCTPLNLQDRINLENWHNYIGDESYFDDFFSFFSKEISDQGHAKFIELYLPVLAKSPLSAAFHCAIRVGYVLKFKKYEDLAYSFAYWAIKLLKVPQIQRKTSSFKNSILNMEYIDKYKKKYVIPTGNIGDRAVFGMGTSEFLELFNLLGSDDKVECAKELSLSVMKETLDFTALHLITGTNAMEVIIDHIPESEKESVELRIMPSLIAAFLSMTKAKKHNLKLDFETSVDEIRKIGATSQNDHVIKFSFVAIEEYNKSGNSLYLALAKGYSKKD